MASEDHFGRALSGALALARFDRRGMEIFDLSHEGFWRSFSAILWTLPIVLAAASLTPAIAARMIEANPKLAANASKLPSDMPLFLLFETVSFAMGWAFFPLAMIWIARKLNLGARYVPLIVASNWSRMVSTYVVGVPVVLFGIGVIGGEFLKVIGVLTVIFLLAYRWFVIRAATGVSSLTAWGLLLFVDILGTFVVRSLIEPLYWLTDPGLAAASGNT